MSLNPTIPNTFLLNVYSDTGTLFSGQIHALSTKNEIGPLSIISGHANFISLIMENLTVFENSISQGGKVIPLELGVMRVFNNATEVYIGSEFAAKIPGLPPADPPPTSS
jgi:F0F1-type ATP synthase epsilon subunit